MSKLLTTRLCDVHSAWLVDLHKRLDFLNIKTRPGNGLNATPIISALAFFFVS